MSLPFRFSIKSLSSRNIRMQTMESIFSDNLSFLDSLVFAPMWIGNNCVDMISGTVLTNSSNPVLPNSVDPMGNLQGSYLATSSQNLIMPNSSNITLGAIDYTIAAWFSLTAATTYPYILEKMNNSASAREYAISHTTNGNISYQMANTAAPGSPILVTATDIDARSTGWHLVITTQSMSENRIGIRTDQKTQYYTAITGTPYSSTNQMDIGCYGTSSFANFWTGAIGPIMIWKRLLSDNERRYYYNNGVGINFNEILK